MNSKFSTSSDMRDFKEIRNPRESDLIYKKKFKSSKIEKEFQRDHDKYMNPPNCIYLIYYKQLLLLLSF
jgi:hypothetical protein